MKALNPATFVKSIEYTSEKILRLVFRMRDPQRYRLSNSQLCEAKYCFKMKRLGS